jgi:peptidoglycan/xylan/chitin deacetylase (PgdA/CDA1 family)
LFSGASPGLSAPGPWLAPYLIIPKDMLSYRSADNAFDVKPRGALVISLDLELHWGVRDRRSLDGTERARLLSARAVIPRFLDLFQEFDVHATWATVGFLFARSREHLERFIPVRKPAYKKPRLDPYAEKIGRDESEDPFHFAPSIIAELRRRPGQEIATHSFSHYYCGEEGTSAADFEADLRSAVAIAADWGCRIQSYVFPRNQVNIDYLKFFTPAGIFCYRGTQPVQVHSAGSFASQQKAYKRLLRLCDSYADLYGPQTQPWPSGHSPLPVPLCTRASRYLRPWTAALRGLDDLRYRRIADAMLSAAVNGELFHLWWHPEDFASNRDINFRFLRRILMYFGECRREFGMRSISMNEMGRMVDDEAGASQPTGTAANETDPAEVRLNGA